MLKTYLVTLLFVLAPLILAALGLWWVLSTGMAKNRYFGILMLRAVIGYGILRYGR